MRDQKAINKKISQTMKGQPQSAGSGTKGMTFPNRVRPCDYHWKFRPFEKLGRDGRRQRVLDEQNGKCLWCGIIEWREEVLTLELDHIDGNRSNNSRENLRGLCPNCHSQTDTDRFRGRKHSEETKQRLRAIHSDAGEGPVP